jgi:hypothetical protein
MGQLYDPPHRRRLLALHSMLVAAFLIGLADDMPSMAMAIQPPGSFR